ncbi:MAG: mate efflux family protein, partial [Lachnospiraceae bacterium]|nr:mate efflux family protein [Lachnospiraceae bacterium]
MTILKRLKIIARDTAFVNKTIRITVPIALQGFLNTALNFADTLMIGKLGETTIAAVGLANKVFFVFTLLIFGIVSGSGILTAQYWGKREVANIRRVLGISLMLVLGGSFLFLIPAVLRPELIMRIFTTSNETIRIGAIYLAIIAFSYPFSAITNAYISLLRGINEVKAPVIISTIAIFVNVILNYILIFGKLGFPVLGVAGAAIATVIARIVECGALLFVVYWEKGPAAAKFRELITFQKDFVKKFFATTLPVIANEFMWGLGVTIYSLVYGRMGDGAVAAITVTQTVEQIFIVIFMSISNGSAVILGNEMGAGHLEDADEHAKNLITIQVLLSFAAGI